MSDPKWTDAKFDVVRQPTPRRVGGGWWFDWRNFLIVGALSAIVSLAPLLKSLRQEPPEELGVAGRAQVQDRAAPPE